MRTTIRIDDDLLAEVKHEAARSGRTLTAVIEDALRENLARRRGPKKRATTRLTTVGGHGTQPDVDLDDSSALLSLMEESDDPS